MIAIIILRRVSSCCGGCDMGAGSFAAQNTRSPCSPATEPRDHPSQPGGMAKSRHRRGRASRARCDLQPFDSILGGNARRPRR